MIGTQRLVSMAGNGVVFILQRRPQGEVVEQLDLVNDAQLTANHRPGSGVQDALQVWP